MEGLGSVQRKRKKKVSAKKTTKARKRRRKSTGVSGVGAVAAVKRRRTRHRGVGRVGRKRLSVRKGGPRGFGALPGGANWMNAAIKTLELGGGAMLAAFATTQFLKNADPEKDKKIKKFRGPAALIAGIGGMVFLKNPHLQNLSAGVAAFGVMRSVGDLLLKDKKDKIGLGVAAPEDIHGYEMGGYEMGELPLVGYEMGELPLVGFGDVGELPLVGFGDVGESPLAAYEMGELSLVGVSDLYGVDRLYGLNGLASPEDRMSGPFEESGTIGYRKRMYDRPLNGPDNVISMQGVAAAFGV